MLDKIFNTISPCGFEDKLRELIKSEFGNKFDEVNIDNIGNLILHKKGNNKKICLECGMDSFGVMVVSCENEKICFSAVGGIEPYLLENKIISFVNGASGVVRYDGNDIKEAKLSDLYIELDAGTVNIGDFGAVASDFRETEDKIFKSELSQKLALSVVLEIIRKIDKFKCDLTILLSAQKRLGARGLFAFLSENKFDILITVDAVGDNINKGCQIIAKDKRGLPSSDLRRYAESVANKNKIPFITVVCNENIYLENIAASGSEANCVALGVGVKHKGKNLEYALKSDVAATAQLIEAICLDAEREGA